MSFLIKKGKERINQLSNPRIMFLQLSSVDAKIYKKNEKNKFPGNYFQKYIPLKYSVSLVYFTLVQHFNDNSPGSWITAMTYLHQHPDSTVTMFLDQSFVRSHQPVMVFLALCRNHLVPIELSFAQCV